MIESKNLVPYYYRQSQDFKVLLKLLDYIVSSYKGEIDDILNLIIPSKCPKKFLPLLADFVGYKYDTNVSEEVNRYIIEQYMNLIKTKGSLNGIGCAVATAIRAIQKTQTPIEKLFLIANTQKILTDEQKSYYHKDFDNENTISVFIYAENFTHKIWDLIRAVKPAGENVIINNSTLVDTDLLTNQIDVSAFVRSIFISNSNESKYYINDDNSIYNYDEGVYIKINRKNVPSDSWNTTHEDELTGNQGTTIGFTEIAHTLPEYTIPSEYTILFNYKDNNTNKVLKLDKSENLFNKTNVYCNPSNSYEYVVDANIGYMSIKGYNNVNTIINMYLQANLINKTELYVLYSLSLSTNDINNSFTIFVNGNIEKKIYNNGTLQVCKIDVSNYNSVCDVYFTILNNNVIINNGEDSLIIHAIGIK